VTTFLSIGDFARMTFLSVKALRHYHEVGLLAPAQVDPATGYRRYGVGQVATAQAIRRLRQLGMPLEQVRVVIEAPDVAARNAAIGAHLRRMEGELERTRATVRSLRLLLDAGAPPAIDVAYRLEEPSTTLAFRAEVAHDDMLEWIDAAFAELHAALAGSGAERAGPDGALFSAELMEEEVGEIVAVVPVGAAGKGRGHVELVELPRVEYAVAVHEGSLDDADRTYAALGAVVAERAIGVQGPIRENYLVGAGETPDESQHRTEICWPVFQTAQAT
jgi:DNA-binding transcriptional MerR regulator